MGEILEPTPEQILHLDRRSSFDERQIMIKKVMAESGARTQKVLYYNPVTEGLLQFKIGFALARRLMDHVTKKFDIDEHYLALDGLWEKGFQKFLTEERPPETPAEPKYNVCDKGHETFLVRMQYRICRACDPPYIEWVNEL